MKLMKNLSVIGYRLSLEVSSGELLRFHIELKNKSFWHLFFFLLVTVYVL